ncbi:MAG: hypothetical protein KAR23_02175, partial [Candidatus Aenigmarchaeota archaeon]|nr:hypothetical protein [Candidatus Aenigmarchaeota archaeon]
NECRTAIITETIAELASIKLSPGLSYAYIIKSARDRQKKIKPRNRKSQFMPRPGPVNIVNIVLMGDRRKSKSKPDFIMKNM